MQRRVFVHWPDAVKLSGLALLAVAAILCVGSLTWRASRRSSCPTCEELVQSYSRALLLHTGLGRHQSAADSLASALQEQTLGRCLQARLRNPRCAEILLRAVVSALDSAAQRR